MDEQADPREEARTYLYAFLKQLAANDRTNMALLNIGQKRLEQAAASNRQFAMISAQLDGVAQRLDILVDHLSALTNVLRSGDDTEIPVQPVQPPQRNSRGQLMPTPGQFLGGAIGYGVDRIIRGGGGRRGG